MERRENDNAGEQSGVACGVKSRSWLLLYLVVSFESLAEQRRRIQRIHCIGWEGTRKEVKVEKCAISVHINIRFTVFSRHKTLHKICTNKQYI